MGKLIFIGLGLGNEQGITLKGLEAARSCDKLFIENYTSILEDGSIQRLESLIDKPIILLDRAGVEADSQIVQLAEKENIAFLVPGDAMSATTHIDLRIRAISVGIETEVIHGVSVFTAIPGLLGLQNYKFGRTITVPLPEPNFKPTSFYEKALENFKAGMHTLCLLDIKQDRNKFMTANEALEVLGDIEKELSGGLLPDDRLVCIVARAGSDDVLVKAGLFKNMLTADFGGPLHSVIIPGELHFLEAKALVELAGAPKSILE